MTSAWQPPVEPWSPSDKQSFAYKSVSQRWPTIITSAIDALFQASYALSYSSNRESAEAKIQESKSIVERMSKLKHDMSRDKALEPIGDDGGDATDEYDAQLQAHPQWTWYSAPWLYAECYLYRLLRSFFARSQHWQQYDPFATQKVAAFRSSATAIAQLSGAVEGLIKKAEQGAQKRTQGDGKDVDESLHVIFSELVQTSLWGNATDLSLLTHMKHADLQELQAGGLGTEAQAKRLHFILSGLDGVTDAWKALLAAAASKTNGQSRVDIILDNSGFELYTDLVLGDFLLSSGLTDQVVFHPKDMPWFVSDTTPSDFLFTLEALQSGDFFTKSQEKGASASGGGVDAAGVPPRTSRSSSRQRAMVADMQSHYEGSERRDMSPAGSRVLRMAAVPEERASNQAYGSRTLTHGKSGTEDRGRAEEAEDTALGERGRPRPGAAAAGSRSLQLDASYFQNARSRTVSPSRSYVMDSGNMPSFSSILRRGGSEADEGDAEESRGRAAVSQHTTATQRLAARWAGYLSSGKFALSMPPNTPLGGTPELRKQAGQADFWTSYHNFPSMAAVAPQLHGVLSQSRLVISKGDLNYRKWCSDARWPNDTPFADVLGPAKGTMNLLVLRTNKADVCVGVPKQRLAGLDKEDAEWRVNGKYAMVEFVAKA